MTKRKNIALILNILAFILGSVGIIYRLAKSFDDFFLYYTQISNVIAVISSAIFIVFRNTGNVKLRTFSVCARYLGACMLTMTFLVVVCIFVPFGTPESTNRLLGSVNGVLHHIACPVISVVSYIFFEDGVKTRRAILIPFISTAIYAFTIYTLNFLRLAGAPYPFFEVYKHPVPELIAWFFGLMAMAAGIAVTVRLLNLTAAKRAGKSVKNVPTEEQK